MEQEEKKVVDKLPKLKGDYKIQLAQLPNRHWGGLYQRTIYLLKDNQSSFIHEYMHLYYNENEPKITSNKLFDALVLYVQARYQDMIIGNYFYAKNEIYSRACEVYFYWLFNGSTFNRWLPRKNILFYQSQYKPIIEFLKDNDIKELIYLPIRRRRRKK